MAIFHQLTFLTAGFPFVFAVLTSSSDSRVLNTECNSLTDTIPDVETGWAVGALIDGGRP